MLTVCSFDVIELRGRPQSLLFKTGGESILVRESFNGYFE